MSDAQQPIQYGRYQLVKKLAAGGMAQVWLARQSGMEGFEKLLVIKQVLPHLADTDEFITMFLDEARLAARLNHPNVVQVFDLGQEDDTLYIAMEYIHGEDLRRIDKASREKRQPIPVPLVCRIVADAAAGLHYAHVLRSPDGQPLDIVHRDVSPQNILVTFDGGVKVVDFGIAKAANKANKTRSGVLKGKYAYMSPEQASGKALDHRTDVFALGIMLHELLTGQRLFKRKSEILTLHAVVRCEVVPPSKLNPVVPAGLDPIVMKALAQDREDRFATAQTFELALEDFLLSLGQPSSNAHLAVYMREVFADRLEVESRDGGPAAYLAGRGGTGSGSVGFLGQAPSRTGGGSAAIESVSRRRVEVADGRRTRVEGTGPRGPARGAAGASEASQHSASKLAEGMQRRRTVLVGAVLGGVAVAGLAGALYLFGHRTGAASAPEVASVGPLGAAAGTTPSAGSALGAPRAGTHAMPPPVGNPAGGGGTQATPTPPPPPVAHPKPPPPVHHRPHGRIEVAITPASAKVSIKRGGRWRPLGSSNRLPPGHYEVRVDLPDGSTRGRTLDVVAGRTRRLAETFHQGRVSVVILPLGTGGTVRSGGKVVGTVPGRPFALYEGPHDLAIKVDGRGVVHRSVTVKAGGKPQKIVVK